MIPLCVSFLQIIVFFPIFLQASFFSSFGQSAEVEIKLNDVEGRKTVEYKTSEQEIKDNRIPLYYDGETVSGKVHRP